MLTINNPCFPIRGGNYICPNNKPYNAPCMKVLDKDTVSFKGLVEEKRFLDAAADFLKDTYSREHLESMQLFVQYLGPKDQTARKFIQEMADGKHGNGYVQGVGNILLDGYGKKP